LISASRCTDALLDLGYPIACATFADPYGPLPRDAIADMYRRSVGVARSNRTWKNSSSRRSRTIGSIASTSANVIGLAGAVFHTSFPYAWRNAG
jgi:hypothetical protein